MQSCDKLNAGLIGIKKVNSKQVPNQMHFINKCDDLYKSRIEVYNTTLFTGVDIPVNSPHSQTMQCSEKL